MTRVYKDAVHRVEVPEKDDTSDPAQVIEAFERMAADWPSAENFLPKLKEQITDILVMRGYPAPDAEVFYRGRDPRPVLAGELPEPGERITLGWKFALQYSEPLTVEREAADVYCNIVVVEDALEGGEAALVFAHALKLGAAVKRFKLRRLHLKTATIGAKKAKDGRIGAAMTKAKQKPSMEKRLARMGYLVPLKGVENAAEQCEFEGLGRAGSIKRYWKKHNKK
jgi:hypothetical protein